MQSANRNGAAYLRDLRRLFADEGFAISILSAVLAANILDFGFGATADVVFTMLVIGVVAAITERRLRK